MQIGFDEIAVLREVHRAGGMVAIKDARVQKIRDWPTPTSTLDVRQFFGVAQSTREWIKNFGEILRPVRTKIIENDDWQWTDVDQLSFDLTKGLWAAAQKVGDTWRFVPLLYDSFLFNKAERNYGTYKRELRALTTFADKHAHLFSSTKQSTIFTDHKLLTGFMNPVADGIYLRWQEKLRPLNIRIEFIEGKGKVAADGLSRAIFNDDRTPTHVTDKLAEELQKHKEDTKEWIWKDGKGGYEDVLATLTWGDKDDYLATAVDVNMIGQTKPPTLMVIWYSTCKIRMHKGHCSECERQTIEQQRHQSRYEDEEGSWMPLGTPVPELAHVATDDEAALATEVNNITATPTAEHPQIASCLSIGTEIKCLHRLQYGSDCVRNYCDHDCCKPFDQAPIITIINRDNLPESDGRKEEQELAMDMQDYQDNWYGDITKLINGVYLVTFDENEAYGIITVNMVTRHPHNNFTAVHNFGSPMLHLKTYEKATTDSGTVEPSPDKETETVIAAVNRVFNRSTDPVAAFFDPGTESAMLSSWLTSCGIYNKPSPTGSRRLTGTVENMLRVIRRCLERSSKSAIVDSRGHPLNTLANWSEEVSKAMKDANHRHIAHLGFSPVQIRLGLQPEELADKVECPTVRRQQLLEPLHAATEADRIGNAYNSLAPDPHEAYQTLHMINHLLNRHTVQHAIRRADHRTKELRHRNHNAHLHSQPLKVGDLVLLKNQHLRQKSKEPPWIGVFKITAHTPDSQHSFVLSAVKNDKQLQGHHHADHLQLFTPRTGYLAALDKHLLMPPPVTLAPSKSKKDKRLKSKSKSKNRMEQHNERSTGITTKTVERTT
ncbi:hypothetical protein TI39_contig408g00001 [Zymoseptoria brevis]|uniref:Reverse transcriptase RNase H-like domain-containing protein n=1 Tax=Zymoseptoria brevis TaxID=1047168 RepID=A0A0F4GQQ4_9PEZI|nr:hypothetical protein TI39_contig408g00001 [Zymoseptoria brevis]